MKSVYRPRKSIIIKRRKLTRKKSMLCQKCKINPVVISYVENVNGNKTEFHLCAACYALIKSDLNNKIQNDFLSGAFRAIKPRKACPVCGTTYAEL